MNEVRKLYRMTSLKNLLLGSTSFKVITVVVVLSTITGFLIALGGERATLVSLVIIGLVWALVIFLVAVVQSPIRTIYLLIIWVFTQDLVVMGLSRLTSETAFKTLGYPILLGKEVLLILAVVYFWFTRPIVPSEEWIWPDRLAIALSAWITLYLIMPNELLGGTGVSLTSKLISARSFLVLLLLYLLGRLIPLDIGDLSHAIRLLLTIGLVSAIIAPVLTSLPASVWESMGLPSLYELKLGQDAANRVMDFPTGLPGNFYFRDFPRKIVPWPGLRRLSSTIVQPISTGLMFSGLFLLAVALSGQRRLTVRKLLFGLVTLLAMSRGGLLVAGIGYLSMRVKKPKRAMVYGLLVVVIVMLIYLFVLPETGSVIGTSMRVTEFASGLGYVAMHPQGSGLGTSGFLTVARAREYILAEEKGLHPLSYESFVGTIGIQTGVMGMGLFLGFMFTLVQRLFQVWRQNYKVDFVLSRVSLAVGSVMIGLTFLAILSSSGYGFVGVGIMFLLSGLIVNAAHKSNACETVLFHSRLGPPGQPHSNSCDKM